MKNAKSGFVRALDFLENRGFYIILFLCVVSIGISGYVLFFTGGEAAEDGPSTYLADPLPTEDPEPAYEVPAVRDQPIPTEPEPTPAPAPNIEPVKPKVEATPAESSPPADKPAINPSPKPKLKAPEIARPVKGQVLHSFSGDRLEYSPTMKDWRVHRGTDFEVTLGEQVVAVMAGVVADVYTDDLHGVCVRVDHENGMETLYTGLMEQTAVEKGQRVETGTVLGGAGDTSLYEAAESTRLHIEFYRDGELANLEDILP